MKDNRPKIDEIIDAASRLFSRKGYKATSLNEIGDEVGLHKTSLFHYFKNKEEILTEIMDRSLAAYINILNYPVIDSNISAEEKFKIALERQIAVVCEYKDYINVYLNEIKSLSPKNRLRYNQKRRQYSKHFEELIREVQADKNSHLFRSLDPKVVTFAVLGMCNWMLNWYKKDGLLTSKEISDIFVKIIMAQW